MPWNRFSAASAMPIGAVITYAGTTAPTNWLFCAGQAVSRTTYSDLFAALSTTYGTGDGSTTFNLPDMRGRVAAGRDNMGGTAASRLTATILSAANTLGATGGTETHTLTTTQIPAHNHSGSADSAGDHYHGTQGSRDTGGGFGVTNLANGNVWNTNTTTNGAHTHSLTINNTGGGGSHPNAQPTIVLNYIIRAL